MTVTAENIYHRTCDKCDRHALTFDRAMQAFCAAHAKSIVRAKPVENEIPVKGRLSG
jgi:hypothetical protein